MPQHRPLLCVNMYMCVCVGGGAPESQSSSATSEPGAAWQAALREMQGPLSLPCPTIADAGQCQACTWVLESELRSYVAQHFTLLSHHHRPRKGCFLTAVSVKDQQVTHKLLYSTAEMQVTIPKSCGHALSDCVGHGGLKPVILSTLSASIGVPA